MRPALALAAALAVVLPGCFGAGFKPTPCKPAGAPEQGTLAVHLTWFPPSERMPFSGCVALQEGERFVAAAPVDLDGNATLPLPKDGSFFAVWRVVDPSDRYCAFDASAAVQVPGPANVTMEAGKVCA